MVRLKFVIAVALVTGIAAQIANAQAMTTADRTTGISAFASASRIYTDYCHDDFGYTLGGDYTRFYRLVAPSFELRYIHSNGNEVTENSFLGGFKVEKGFARFRPYVNILFGYGSINNLHAIPNYTHDNSAVIDPGIGLEYRISPHFAIKADIQQQFWRVGTESHEMEPRIFSIGVTYRIPFGQRRHE